MEVLKLKTPLLNTGTVALPKHDPDIQTLGENNLEKNDNVE